MIPAQIQTGLTGADAGREFSLGDRDFQVIVKLAGERAGIVLGPGKREMIYSRLVRRLRHLGLSDFSEYTQLLLEVDSQEMPHFINAITTNLTSFFREPHHFAYLAGTAVPALMQARKDKKLRVWSAGCSTGEEPYSIAMTLAESLPAGWTAEITASDLDTNVLATASAGIYAQQSVNDVGEQRLKKWFERGTGDNRGLVRVVKKLRDTIQFRQINLIQHWPIDGKFDIIFCRNVVIYFDKPTRTRLFNRYADIMPNDGYVFVGHSESLLQICDRFAPVGRTIYRKGEVKK